MTVEIINGDCLDVLRSLGPCSVQCCVTSPPYWGLRDYGCAGQIGLEQTPEEYVSKLVEVFREVRRVLRDDETLWLNLGDSYATGGTRSTGRNDTDRETPGGRGGSFRGGSRIETEQIDGLKPKDLVGIPWRVAFALQADGWYLRQDIIWVKPNPMPESVTDRCTKAHEYLFLLAKSERYRYDHEAIKEPAVQKAQRRMVPHAERAAPGGGAPHRWKSFSEPSMTPVQDSDGVRNRRSVWTISTKPFAGAHFAVMPEDLVNPCIMAGTKPGDVVLDPFTGAGTVAYCAKELGRSFVGAELNQAYCKIAEKRLAQEVLL